MTESNRIENEIGYIKNLVSKSDRGQSPVVIYLLWAAICLVGFPLADFAPRYVGTYWSIAGPAGAIISMILGWRHGVRVGQRRRDLGIRHGLHWAGTLVAIFLMVPLGVFGFADWNVVYRAILLLLALSYFLAGVHLERPMLWIGLLMIAAYAALYYIDDYQWTMVGIVLAVAMTATGLIGGRNRVKEAD